MKFQIHRVGDWRIKRLGRNDYWWSCRHTKREQGEIVGKKWKNRWHKSCKLDFLCMTRKRETRTKEIEEVEEVMEEKIEIFKIHPVMMKLSTLLQFKEGEEDNSQRGWVKKKKKELVRDTKSQIVCYKCDKFGHFAWEYRSNNMEQYNYITKTKEKGERRKNFTLYKAQEEE